MEKRSYFMHKLWILNLKLEAARTLAIIREEKLGFERKKKERFMEMLEEKHNLEMTFF